MSNPEVYYRYEATGTLLDCVEYKVIKHTQCGVWIELYPGKKKFILNNTYKKWAAPTKEAALESYYARKEKQIRILKDRLRLATEQSKYKPGWNESSFTFIEI